jgi:hypothetical protein
MKTIKQIINEEIKKLKNNQSNINKKFWKWFKNSQVVDNSGNPLIVYHGSNSQIKKFDPKFSAQGVFWFSSDKNKIEAGESGASSRAFIIPVYLSAQKLAGWKEYEKLGLGQIEEQGYDGIKLDNDYVIFNPQQIKSINNDGSWDINDKNINS